MFNSNYRSTRFIRDSIVLILIPGLINKIDILSSSNWFSVLKKGRSCLYHHTPWYIIPRVYDINSRVRSKQSCVFKQAGSGINLVSCLIQNSLIQLVVQIRHQSVFQFHRHLTINSFFRYIVADGTVAIQANLNPCILMYSQFKSINSCQMRNSDGCYSSCPETKPEKHKQNKQYLLPNYSGGRVGNFLEMAFPSCRIQKGCDVRLNHLL